MNLKRYILSSIAVFVLFEAMDIIVHSFILSESYKSLSAIWRPDMMSLMWVMLITTAVLSLGFVYIFVRVRKKPGVIEGVRFGALMGVFYCGTGIFNQYVVYPIPLSLAIQWFTFGVIEFIASGIVAALIYSD